MSQRMTAKQMAREIIEHMEVRRGDPWDDHLWPAAFEVLTLMADELREMWNIKRTPMETYDHRKWQEHFKEERIKREAVQS